MTHHQHRQLVALVKLADQAENLRRRDEVHAVRRLIEHENVGCPTSARAISVRCF